MTSRAADSRGRPWSRLTGGRIRPPAIALSATGSLIAVGIGQVILIVSGILATRLLGPENRGHLALFVLIPTVLSVVGLFGVPDALMYWIAKDGRTGLPLIRSMIWQFAIQLGVCTVLHAVALLALVHNEPSSVQRAGYLTILITPAFVVHAYCLAVLQGTQRFAVANVFRILPSILYGAGLAPIFLMDDGRLPAVALAWTLSYIVVVAVMVVTTARLLPRGEPAVPISPPRELFQLGLKGFLGSVSPLETLRLDQAAVGLILSPTALGYYVAALAFVNMPRFFAYQIATVAFPHIASRTNEALARRAMWRFFWATVGGTVLMAVVLGFGAPLLVEVAFGDEFDDAIVPLQILSVGVVTYAARRVLGEGMRAMGHPTANTIAEVASWFWLVLALLVCIPLWDLNGVAVAMTTTSLCSLGVLIAQMVAGRKPVSDAAEETGGLAPIGIPDG